MHARAVMRFSPLIMGLALLCASCGPKAPKLHPVQGKVQFLGKPAPGAIVVFHPVDESDPRAPRPSGIVDEQGFFRLGTHALGDGAPAGDYLVAIAWLGDATKRDAATGEVPSKLPPRYADPRSSNLRVMIKEGSNELEAFQLTP